MMGMGQKAVPALAAGNTVVVKPPEIAPFGALRFAELALEAGLPPGALNVVVGGAAAGDALVRHPGIDKVSFTGGCATARLVMAAAAETLTPAHVRARREVGEHRVPRRRPRRRHVDGGDARRGAAERAGLRAADPPLRARRRLRRRGRTRRRPDRSGDRRRSVRPVGADGPGGERTVLHAHPRRDPTCGRRGRREAAHRWSTARRCARRRLLRRADRVRRRRPRQLARARGDLRAGALGAALLRRGRGRGQGERQRLRPVRLPAHARLRRARAAGSPVGSTSAR